MKNLNIGRKIWIATAIAIVLLTGAVSAHAAGHKSPAGAISIEQSAVPTTVNADATSYYLWLTNRWRFTVITKSGSIAFTMPHRPNHHGSATVANYATHDLGSVEFLAADGGQFHSWDSVNAANADEKPGTGHFTWDIDGGMAHLSFDVIVYRVVNGHTEAIHLQGSVENISWQA